MIANLEAFLSILSLFGALAGVVTYFVLDHSETSRNKPLMRLIRGTAERADTAFDNAPRSLGRFVFKACVVVFGLVVLIAVLKWSLEELVR